MTDLDADVEVVAAPHLSGTERYLNRETSWLDFNARVLALAEDTDRPLLERVKFVAIFSQNLDEFFQVRVAGLKAQRLAGIRSGLGAPGPTEQLAEIGERVRELTRRLHWLFRDDIAPALAKESIAFVGWDDIDGRERRSLSKLFSEQIQPVLTPLAVDPAHPFPYISNLSLNLAVLASDPAAPEPRFARVKVPPSLPRFVALADGERFLPLEDLIAARLEGLFPGMEILSQFPFRVTRSADLEVEEDEAEDLLSAIEVGLRHRRRSPHVVRLEIGDDMTEYVRELLVDELELESSDVYAYEAPLDLSGLWMIHGLDRPDLNEPSWTPATPPRLTQLWRAPAGVDLEPRSRPASDELSVFDVLRGGDVLVHHPYESFHTSVETFVEQAASDPDVRAIKWTLYRTSGPESPVIRNLIRASELGKQVVALVELKARFDEEANIAWARALEEAGVHVVYGLVGFKTHAKVALVVRQEGHELRRYTHVGTGNYNPSTAAIYEDVGVLSADPELGSDLSDLFNFLTGYSRQRAFRKILVAPLMLREQILDLIGREARPGGRIVMKMNHLLDPRTIDALYAASEKGGEIDLVVRGMCALRPGIDALSSRIRVRSLVGRFLEHSRILRFGADPQKARYFIGSADMMPRNLDHRVEVLLPIEDPLLKLQLDEILEVNLADDSLAWKLGPQGDWRRVKGGNVSTHEHLQSLALTRSHTLEADG